MLFLWGCRSANLILALYQVCGLQIFPPTQHPLLCRSFLVQCNPLVHFCFCCLCFWCHIPKKPLFTSKSRGFFHMFSCRSFMDSGLTYKSNPFCIDFYVQCKMRVQCYSSACGYPLFPTPFIVETVFSTLYILCNLVKDQVTINT